MNIEPPHYEDLYIYVSGNLYFINQTQLPLYIHISYISTYISHQFQIQIKLRTPLYPPLHIFTVCWIVKLELDLLLLFMSEVLFCNIARVTYVTLVTLQQWLINSYIKKIYIKSNQLHAVCSTQHGKQREPIKTFRSPLTAEFWRHCVLSGGKLHRPLPRHQSEDRRMEI